MIVFTNGCFDLLHAGHVSHLEQSKAFGGSLIVGLNSDASVRRLKGEGRPIQAVHQRAAVLWALRCVSCVQVFDGDSPLDLVLALRPAVYACGPDHDPAAWEPIVREWGGVVRQTVELPGVRTTSTIEGIRCTSS